MAIATTTALTVAGMAASAAATAASMSAQKSAASAQAKAQADQATADATVMHTNAALSKIDAERTQRASIIQAEKIREAAITIRGQQSAAQAVSGTELGTGSNLAVQEDTTKKAEADALATVMEGIYGVVNKSATARYQDMAASETATAGARAAKTSLLAGNWGQATTLANGVSNMLKIYKNFNTSGTTTNGKS